jgi:MFS family permease
VNQTVPKELWPRLKLPNDFQVSARWSGDIPPPGGASGSDMHDVKISASMRHGGGAIMSKSNFYGWKMLFVLWLILVVHIMPFYGAGLISSYMAQELHFDRKMLGTAFAIHQIALFPGPLAAYCVNRTGVRFTLMLGCFTVAIGALLMATVVHTSMEINIVFGLIIGLGTLANGLVATQSSVGRWFERRKAFAISLVMTGTYIGGFFAAPMLNWFITLFHGNWRAAWGAIAVMSFMATLLALFFVKEWPADVGQFPDGERGAGVAPRESSPQRRHCVHRTRDQWHIGEVLRSPTLWLMLLAGVGASAGYVMFLGHGVAHLQDLGHSTSQAAYGIALAALCGTLSIAFLGDRIEPRFLWAIASCAVAIGLVLALRSTSAAGLYACVILIGGGFGMTLPCQMTLPGNYFGHKAYSSAIGIMCTTTPTAGAAGAYAAGLVYSRSGSYDLAFHIIAAICLVGALVALALTPPIRRSISTPKVVAE